MWTSPGGSVNNNSPTGGTTELPLEYSTKPVSIVSIKSMPLITLIISFFE